jgi:hypothetical protein
MRLCHVDQRRRRPGGTSWLPQWHVPVACCNLGLHQATAKAGGFGSSRLSSSRDTGPEERCGFNAARTLRCPSGA